ncbi:putative F-box/kelch-repeat protein At3g17570 [Phoenix dactylifera]|uniref:F-box/kelch-repeat protein At3g17570 n=1 Tax=Phoenix dactylifera TaxID=42345 RepID=A0A8B8ZV52_PHODC|nr:putative F-box/kelch-repeat protein At3g17570 [Phoenix dactylifera]
MASSSKPMIGEGGDGHLAEKKEKEKRRILPADMQREILSRTLARSLLRFRPACKIWYELTYDPAFIDLHVERAHLRKISGGTPHLLAISQRIGGGHFGFSIIILDETMTPITKISCPGLIDERCLRLYFGRNRFARSTPPYRMTRPCNGLVCVYNYFGDALLVNSMTGEGLPLRQHSEPVESYYCFQKCYLGFHPVTKEYKLVRFLDSGRDSMAEVFYEVLTLGTGIWRRRRIYHGDKNLSACSEDFLSGYEWHQTKKILGDGISANGVVYILNQIHRKIGLFDLKEEKFSTVIPYHDSISVD